jgi:hypothetical protein
MDRVEARAILTTHVLLWSRPHAIQQLYVVIRNHLVLIVAVKMYHRNLTQTHRETGAGAGTRTRVQAIQHRLKRTATECEWTGTVDRDCFRRCQSEPRSLMLHMLCYIFVHMLCALPMHVLCF